MTNTSRPQSTPVDSMSVLAPLQTSRSQPRCRLHVGHHPVEDSAPVSTPVSFIAHVVLVEPWVRRSGDLSPDTICTVCSHNLVSDSF